MDEHENCKLELTELQAELTQLREYYERTANHVSAILNDKTKELTQLREQQWNCPACGFTCEKIHVEDQPDEEKCPACNEQRLREEIIQLDEEIAQLREELNKQADLCQRQSEAIVEDLRIIAQLKKTVDEYESIVVEANTIENQLREQVAAKDAEIASFKRFYDEVMKIRDEEPSGGQK